MTTAVFGPEGGLDAPEIFRDRSNVDPGYAIRKPYSYSQTVFLPALPKQTQRVVISFTYELLVQTQTGSSQYVKQTASDELTIPLVN
jgi:hypothetical protein